MPEKNNLKNSFFSSVYVFIISSALTVATWILYISARVYFEEYDSFASIKSVHLLSLGISAAITIVILFLTKTIIISKKVEDKEKMLDSRADNVLHIFVGMLPSFLMIEVIGRVIGSIFPNLFSNYAITESNFHHVFLLCALSVFFVARRAMNRRR